MSFAKKIKAPIIKVAKYARNFGISALIDISIFAVIIFFAKKVFTVGTSIVIAGLRASILSSLINFKLNRELFKGKNNSQKRSLVRYYILWGTLITLSITLTYILNDLLSINEVIAKMMSDVSLGIFSYLTQLRWVFNDIPEKKPKGLYYRFVRKIFRIFVKRERVLDDEIFNEANVLVGHHQGFYGPISCGVWLPDTVHIWVISHLLNFKDCFDMYYNYTFKKTIKLPRPLAFLAAFFPALLIPPLLRSGGAVPVYRESRKIIETLNQSVDLLNRGHQVLIFPDVEYDENNDKVGEIHTGFFHLEKLYYRSNNQHLGFVPIITDKKMNLITNSNAIYFRDDKAYKTEKDIVANEIIDNINLNCNEEKLIQKL